MRADVDDGSSTPQSSGPVPPSSGRHPPERASGFGPSANWGRPAFGGGGIPPAGPAATWGRLNGAGNGIPTRPGSTQPDRSNTPGADDLLPHEQRARELMLERENKAQQREVKIHAGPGPESTRSGRPQPYSREERLEMARANLAKKKAREKDLATNGSPFKIYRSPPRHSLGDSQPAPHPTDQDSRDLPRWSQLRRRAQESARDSPNPREDRFAEGRAQRGVGKVGSLYAVA